MNEKRRRNILYHICRHKFIGETHRCSLGYLVGEYREELDKADVQEIVGNLVEQGYLVKYVDGNDEVFWIENARKFHEIKKLFWKRRALDRIKTWLLEIWQFMWKHFIVTIIVAVITAYITAKIVK